jgi:hypothetical protein
MKALCDGYTTTTLNKVTLNTFKTTSAPGKVYGDLRNFASLGDAKAAKVVTFDGATMSFSELQVL